MKATFNVKELSHEDLVNWLSTATYGNEGQIHISPGDIDWKNLTSADTLEDSWADILLNGGTLVVADMNADPCYDIKDVDQLEYYGAKGINWLSTKYQEFTNSIVDLFGKVHHTSKLIVPSYVINLDTILAGINHDTEESKFLVEDMFICDSYDMYTAYNLLQVVVFGEIVYG